MDTCILNPIMSIVLNRLRYIVVQRGAIGGVERPWRNRHVSYRDLWRKDMDQLLHLLKNATQHGQSVSSRPINAGVRKDGQLDDVRFIHTVVPISDETGSAVNRLFIYSEKVA